MSVLGVNSGGALAVKEENGKKTYRLIDILELESQNRELRVGKISRYIGESALAYFSEKINRYANSESGAELPEQKNDKIIMY